MRQLVTTFIVLSLLITIASAAMDPVMKECSQRGYTIDSDSEGQYCIFPDGSKCPLLDFNDGLCGSEYLTEDYCVKEGQPVWDKDKCCEGTEAYIPPRMIGQPTCQKVTIAEKIADQIFYGPFFSIFVVILVIVVIVLFWFRKR